MSSQELINILSQRRTSQFVLTIDFAHEVRSASVQLDPNLTFHDLYYARLYPYLPTEENWKIFYDGLHKDKKGILTRTLGCLSHARREDGSLVNLNYIQGLGVNRLMNIGRRMTPITAAFIGLSFDRSSHSEDFQS